MTYPSHRFVSGRDFSRADRGQKKVRALALQNTLHQGLKPIEKGELFRHG